MSQHKNCDLIINIDKLHTTELGVIRIKRNLSLDVDDVVKWCYEKILNNNVQIVRKGKIGTYILKAIY